MTSIYIARGLNKKIVGDTIADYNETIFGEQVTYYNHHEHNAHPRWQPNTIFIFGNNKHLRLGNEPIFYAQARLIVFFTQPNASTYTTRRMLSKMQTTLNCLVLGCVETTAVVDAFHIRIALQILICFNVNIIMVFSLRRYLALTNYCLLCVIHSPI